MLTRGDIRKVSCPFCKVQSGFLCIARNGARRVSSHVSRVKLCRVSIMLNKPKKAQKAKSARKPEKQQTSRRAASKSHRPSAEDKKPGTPRFDDGNLVIEKF